jgi:hypothetical protein
MPPALRVFWAFPKFLCGPTPSLFFPDLETKTTTARPILLGNRGDLFIVSRVHGWRRSSSFFCFSGIPHSYSVYCTTASASDVSFSCCQNVFAMPSLLPKSGVCCPNLRGTIIRRPSNDHRWFLWVYSTMLALSLGVVVPRSGDPALMWRVASFSRLDGLGVIGQACVNLLGVLGLCVCGDLLRSSW